MLVASSQAVDAELESCHPCCCWKELPLCLCSRSIDSATLQPERHTSPEKDVPVCAGPALGLAPPD